MYYFVAELEISMREWENWKELRSDGRKGEKTTEPYWKGIRK